MTSDRLSIHVDTRTFEERTMPRAVVYPMLSSMPVAVVSRRDASGKYHEIRRFPRWTKADRQVKGEPRKPVLSVIDSE